MLLEGCTTAFTLPVCPSLSLLSRVGDILPDIDIFQCWDPVGSLPHAAGQVPDAATTMLSTEPGRGSSPLSPGQSRSLALVLAT